MSTPERWERVAKDAIENTRRAVAVSQQALAERDAARLELRALEWLTLGDHFGDVLWMRAGKPWTSAGAWKDGGFRVEEIEHPTYASAARALGWEG